MGSVCHGKGSKKQWQRWDGKPGRRDDRAVTPPPVTATEAWEGAGGVGDRGWQEPTFP